MMVSRRADCLKPINISIGGTNHYILKGPGGAPVKQPSSGAQSGKKRHSYYSNMSADGVGGAQNINSNNI